MPMKDWSTTAATNATAGTINWAEGQMPSTVNGSARQLMADVRTWYEDAEWRDWGHVTTYASATSFTIPTDVTAVYTAGRRVRIVSGGTLYGTVSSSSYGAPNTTVNVTLDSGSLSNPVSSVAVGLAVNNNGIGGSALSSAMASPPAIGGTTPAAGAFTTLSATGNSSLPTVNGVAPYRVNDIINGAFRVAQAGTSFAAPASDAYDLDGWLFAKAGSTAVVTIAQAAGSSTGKLCRTSTVTTADAAVAAGDYVAHATRIEGYDAVKYLGNTFTIGFRVKSAVTGIHCLSIYDGTSSYVAEYTINVANTWEYKTITVTGGAVALASTTNAYGLQITWANMAGSTFQTTAGAWNAGVFYATANQVNDVATNGNVFALEDVTLNLGTVAAPNEATYQEEELRCKRYYRVLNVASFRTNRQGATFWNGNGNAMAFDAPMRATPTWLNPPTAWVASGTPAAGQISCYNYATSAYGTITGALTVAAHGLYAGGMCGILCTAGTSFNGTAGDSGIFFLGEFPILAARL